MQDIHRVLRAAARRLWVAGLIQSVVGTLSVLLVLAILLRVAEQLFAFVVPWGDVALWGGVGALLGAMIWATVFRAKQDAVARRVDEGADLKESISTALCVATEDNAWSRATVESAAEKARKVHVGQALPYAWPRLLEVPLCLAVALLIVWVAVPKMDLAGLAAAAEEEQAEKDRIQLVNENTDNVKKLEEEIKKLLEEEGEGAEPDTPEGMTEPQDMSVEQQIQVNKKKLTELANKLNEKIEGKKGETLEALQDKLQNLKPGGSELNELTRAMAKSDFKAAAAELSKMQEKLESGEMSGQGAEALAEQLENLSEQMEQLANERASLEQKLEKMGVDPALASDPNALQEALEQAQQNGSMSEQQAQELQQASESMQSASEMMQNMSEMMSQMSQAMSQSPSEMGQMSQEAMQAMEGMQGALSEMEMMSMDMQQAEAMMGEAMDQLAQMSGSGDGEGQGGMGMSESDGMGGTQPFSEGPTNISQGNGSGGPGQGGGRAPGPEQAATKWKTEKDLGVLGPGRTIGETYVDGLGIKNESVVQFQAAIAQAEQEVAESIEGNRLPREYQDAVKHYFGRLKKKVETQKAPEQETPDDPPAESDAPAEDG